MRPSRARRPGARQVRPDGIVVGGAVADGGDLGAVGAGELRQRRAEGSRRHRAHDDDQDHGERRESEKLSAAKVGERRKHRDRRQDRALPERRERCRHESAGRSPYRMRSRHRSERISATSAIGSAIESIAHRLQSHLGRADDGVPPKAVDRFGRRRRKLEHAGQHSVRDTLNRFCLKRYSYTMPIAQNTAEPEHVLEERSHL